MLTVDQSNIIDRIVAEKHTNFRILGRAGTGKTFTLQHLIRALYAKGQMNACIAPTGAAAVRVSTVIGGKQVFARTIAGFLGFRNPKDFLVRDSEDKMVPMDFGDDYKAERAWNIEKNVLNRPKTINDVSMLKTLIIEECSMVDDDMLERISDAFSEIRGNDAPFGGVRVILVGDFKQLRPIKGRFMFESDLYKELDLQHMKLEKIIRTDEQPYIEFQEQIAVQGGRILDMPFVKDKWVSDSDLGARAYDFTHLFDRNHDALAWNSRAITQLFPSAHFEEFDMYDDTREWDDPRKVNLCVGMRVMITANAKDLSCVNGDIGVIESFAEEDTGGNDDNGEKVRKLTPHVKLNRNGEIVTVPWKVFVRYDARNNKRTIYQLPCRPGYAATVHKFQGLTSDGIVVRSKRNEHGKQFVAFTRCRSAAGLLLHRDDMGAAPRTYFDPSTPLIDF